MPIIPVIIGETARLSLVLEDGDTGQFPQANIYESGNTSPIATLDLGHFNEGLYEEDYTPSALGALNVVYTVYEDAAHTTPNANYSKELDQVLVSSDSNSAITDLTEKILRLLGLTHENAFIDNTVYDNCDQLISSRLRIFESASQANAATDGGSEPAYETYQVTVDYDGPMRMKSYRMVKL